jgi:hypothetical protein
MKHIKLFEGFMNSQGLKAISVFMDGGSELYIGTFNSKMADEIYRYLMDTPYIIKMIDIPVGDDLVYCKLGGEGLSTANSERDEIPDHKIVTPAGYHSSDRHIDSQGDEGFFIPVTGSSSFTKLDGSGGVTSVSPDEVVEEIKKFAGFIKHRRY